MQLVSGSFPVWLFHDVSGLFHGLEEVKKKLRIDRIRSGFFVAQTV